jgi:cellulose synthase/poly-beta-1,6-N-acetylglucosamine synthase-like glycosyltransferase
VLSYFIIIFSLVLLYYIYDGYGRLLTWLAHIKQSEEVVFSENVDDKYLPSISVILPVYNEEERVVEKLKNLLLQGYPSEKFEILVISDGSTDETDKIVDSFCGEPVRLLRTKGRAGKSLAQNQAVYNAVGDILILTDVAVMMESGCLRSLVLPFIDDEVGSTTARLFFKDDENSDVGQDQGMYWRYELKLRYLESKLGWLATAAGPAMAIRRKCWIDLPSEFGDDCVLPLDVALQGLRVVQVENAIAWDENFSDFRKEFRARVRMTVRNWTGTVSRSVLLNPLKKPGYAFALISHKILRWLSPVFILSLGFGLFLLFIETGVWFGLGGFLLILLFSFIGVLAMVVKKRLPVLSTLASFFIANAGFAMGLLHVMRGKLVRVYDNK